MGKAPITETLAAALIMFTPWKAERILIDPFVAVGHFPIEAAMIVANIAPGLKRTFLSESWGALDTCFGVEASKAGSGGDMVDTSVKMDIQAFDIDEGYCEGSKGKCKACWGGGVYSFSAKDPSVL